MEEKKKWERKGIGEKEGKRGRKRVKKRNRIKQGRVSPIEAQMALLFLLVYAQLDRKMERSRQLAGEYILT